MVRRLLISFVATLALGGGVATVVAAPASAGVKEVYIEPYGDAWVPSYTSGMNCYNANNGVQYELWYWYWDGAEWGRNGSSRVDYYPPNGHLMGTSGNEVRCVAWW